jgi:hypothetical protein
MRKRAGGPSLPRAYARAVAALDWRYRTAERAHADRGAQTLHQAGRTGRVRGCRGRRDSAGVVAPIRSGGLLQFLFAPTAASYATPDGAGLRREVSHRPDAGVPQRRRQPVRHVRVCAPRPPHVPRRLCGHRALNTRDVGKNRRDSLTCIDFLLAGTTLDGNRSARHGRGLFSPHGVTTGRTGVRNVVNAASCPAVPGGDEVGASWPNSGEAVCRSLRSPISSAIRAMRVGEREKIGRVECGAAGVRCVQLT